MLCTFYFIANSRSILQAQSNNARVQKCVAIADSTLQNMLRHCSGACGGILPRWFKV